MTYRVEVERDESGGWFAWVPQVRGCHTQGRTLRQIKERIREALSLWVDDAETAELDLHVHLPAGARRQVRTAQAARVRAEKAQREAQSMLSAVAGEMVHAHGLSLRDVADLIGLSHQRVQQLVSESSR